MLGSVYDVLQTLKGTSSTNDKKAILLENKDMPDLKETFLYAYDDFRTYGILQIPSEAYSNPSEELRDNCYSLLGEEAEKVREIMSSRNRVWEVLDLLSARKFTGKRAEYLLSILSVELRQEDRFVVNKILNRDLDCGVSYGIIDKTWQGLIKGFGIAKAEPYTSVEFPAQAEIKMNGVRVVIEVEGNKTNIYSSSGKLVPENRLLNLRNSILFLAEQNNINSVMFDGELTCSNRKTVSGVFNKALKNTLTDQEELEAQLEYTIFDTLPLKAWRSQLSSNTAIQSTRNKHLDYIFSRNVPKQIKRVKSFIVDNDEDLQELFHRVYKEQREEGLIVKDLNSRYSFKRDKSWTKLKGINEADLRIVGFTQGTGKRANTIGALICESQDKKIIVNVGSGLTDEDLEMFSKDKEFYIGKIATIMFNEIINNKEGQYSLFLPRFIEVRTDKTEADNVEKILAECNGGEL